MCQIKPTCNNHRHRRLLTATVVAMTTFLVVAFPRGLADMQTGRLKPWKSHPDWCCRDPFEKPYRAFYKRLTGVDLYALEKFVGSIRVEAPESKADRQKQTAILRQVAAASALARLKYNDSQHK